MVGTGGAFPAPAGLAACPGPMGPAKSQPSGVAGGHGRVLKKLWVWSELGPQLWTRERKTGLCECPVGPQNDLAWILSLCSQIAFCSAGLG